MNHANDNNQPLRFLSVCSGIEAASVAWEPIGWRAVGFAEIDKAARALLAYRYPDVPNHGDFSKLKASDLPHVDIFCGGTPCQAFSVAGARRGLGDDRGNLSLEFVRLAHELATSNGLRNAVWENVPGVLTMADNAFGCFLAGLVGADSPFIPTERLPANGKSSRWWRWAGKEKCHAPKWPSAGMVVGPKGRAAWIVKDAQFFGLAQRRERVLVVADFGNGADPAAVLFERGSVPWDPPARGKAGEGVAGYAASSIGNYRESDVSGPVRAAGGDNGGGSENLIYAPGTARCDATREGSSRDYESTTMVVSATGPISHALTAEGHDASEDGSGRGAPIIAFTAKDYGADAQEDLAPTLRSGGHKNSHANAGVMPAIAFNPRSTDANVYGEQTGALDASIRGRPLRLPYVDARAVEPQN